MQEFCWGQGGYLAELLSAEEEDSLDQFLIKGVHYWIGLNDLSVEGTVKILTLNLTHVLMDNEYLN